jgi:hypothetical protein
MTHHENALIGEGELKTEGDHWFLKLGKIGNGKMSPGEDAFAVAVAMIEDKRSGNQQVIWWGHPVKLDAAAAA